MIRRLHRDERGQSLAIILALITVLFLMGSALAAHASVALMSTAANEAQAGDLHAADAGAELGMWWQRNGNSGITVPTITINGLNVTTGFTSTTACPKPTPVEVTGFEYGVISAPALFSGVTGTGLSADAAVSRTGTYSLKDTDAVGSASNGALAIAAGTAVVRVYLRLASLPAADVNDLLILDTALGNDLRLGYQQSSKKLTLRFGAAVVTVASSTVAAATWYRIDLRLIASANPRLAVWQIDGAVQTPINSGETGSTVSTLQLGSSTVVGDTFTANYDDVYISTTSGDWPIGPGTVVGLRPDGMGGNNTPTSFRDDDTTAVDATSYQRVDDDPLTNTTQYIYQRTAGGTAYEELTMADTAATCIVGVSGVVAYHAANNNGNNGKTSFFDGATERIIYSGTMGVNTLTYRSTIVPPAVSPWTTAKVNGLTARIGYSTDVGPTPDWDGLLLEVATGIVVPGTVTVTSTGGGSTVTTTYTDVGAASPTLLTWSTTR